MSVEWESERAQVGLHLGAGRKKKEEGNICFFIEKCHLMAFDKEGWGNKISGPFLITIIFFFIIHYYLVILFHFPTNHILDSLIVNNKLGSAF